MHPLLMTILIKNLSLNGSTTGAGSPMLPSPWMHCQGAPYGIRWMGPVIHTKKHTALRKKTNSRVSISAFADTRVKSVRKLDKASTDSV